MATKLSERIQERKKKLKEEGRVGSSSTSSEKKELSLSDRIKKRELEKEIGFDTFNDDLKYTSTLINNVYDNWQTERQMSNMKDSIRAMNNRIRAYQKYQSAYGGTDISDVVNGYKSVLSDWDALTETYGRYDNADSYKKAMKQAQMDKDFAGLTYEEVQAKLKQYGTGTDEHKYLSNYTGYKSSADFDKAIGGASSNEHKSELEKAKNIYELDHAGDSYLSLKDNEDFAEKSKYVSTVKNDKIFGLIDNITRDQTYEYVNNVNGARADLEDQHTKYQSNSALYTPSEWSEMGLSAMNDEEIAIYNYLYATEGKESAKQYLKDIEVMLTKRISDAQADSIREEVDNSALASVGLSLVSPILNVGGGIYSGIDSLGSFIKGEEHNPYNVYHSATNMANDIRTEVGANIAENTDWKIGSENVLANLYNSGMSILDTAVGSVSLNKGYTALMGFNAYQQRAKQLKEQGASELEIKRGAFGSGMAEFIGELVGANALFKIKGVDSFGTALKYLANQAVTEGSEEGITELLNIGIDMANRGNMSDAYQTYKSYLDEGFSTNEALGKTIVDNIEQVAWATAGGALSGLVLGGGTSGIQYHNLKSTGKQLGANNRTQDVMDMFTPEEAETYELYSQYAKKGVTADNIKPAQLGNLYATKAQHANDTYHSGKSTTDEKVKAIRTMDALSNYMNTKAVTVKATGEKVSIDGVKTVDGETVFVTDQGEIAAKNLDLSKNETKMIEYTKDMSEEMSNLFVSQYDGKSDIDTYKAYFDLAYAYGETRSGHSALFDKTTLTSTQIEAIYKAGKKTSYAKQEAAVQKLKEEYTKDKFIKGEVNDSAIDYTDGGKGEVNWSDLSDMQKANITFQNALYTGLGVDVVWTTKGKEKGFNGHYDKDTNTITLDVYAGIDKDNKKATDDLKLAITKTSSHELTHWLEAKAPALYAKLEEQIFDALYKVDGLTKEDRIEIKKKHLAELDKKSNRKTREITDAEVIAEIVAEGCEDMLSMSEIGKETLSRLTKSERKTLFDKVKGLYEDAIEFIDKMLGTYKSNSYEATTLRRNKEALEEVLKTWEEAMKEAMEVNQAMKSKGLTDKDLIESVEKVGISIDAETNSAYPSEVFSRRTWEESDYATNREVAATNLAKALGISKKKAEKYIDDINSVARIIADDKARLDYEPNIDSSASVMKPNSDYKWSIDMSTLCAKRLLFTGTFDAIQRALPNTVFTSEDIVKLRKMMMERAYEVACGICYVESTRREIGAITQQFIDNYKESQRTGKPITRTNSKGKVVELKKTQDQMKTTVDKSTDRFIADKDYTPTLADLNTTDIDLVKRDHPLVYEAYLNFMNARGQSKPKLLETRAEYKGEIAKKFKRLKDGSLKDTTIDMNESGGLRLQSFSDFEVAHLIDMMQVIMDMANVGLYSQAYTKVPAFAEVFGDTGVKINLSLIAKGSGLDKDGNLIFDDVEGINHKEAFRLREKYSKNVGTILVGKNDEHIIKAMADPRIDYIIPFHKSSWREDLYEDLGLTGYENYTDTQHEKAIDKDRTIADFKPSEYWDYSKSGDENAKIYLEKCKADGRIPKFPQFQGYEGYWKLLIDFKMYDNDGVGSPQTTVVPKFDMEAATRILGEYEGGHRKLPVAKDVVDDFVSEHRQYSRRDYAPTFYSHMGRVVSDIKQAKLGADSVIPYLKGKGVKDEEIKWSGIEEFLNGKKSVTKEELEEFVAGSMLQIEEEPLKFNQDVYDELDSMWIEHIGAPLEESFPDLENLSEDSMQEAIDWMKKEGYKTPSKSIINKMKVLVGKLGHTRWNQYRTPFGENYRELLFKMPNSDYSNSAMQTHWGKKGILAHARIQDMNTENGKMLFIEEIQSDWHNEGQKKGYTTKEVFKLRQEQDEIASRHKPLWNRYNRGEITYEEFHEESKKLQEKYSEVEKKLWQTIEQNKISEYAASAILDAPFRNNYHEYVLKRLIRMAAEEGYASIGWTTGEMQEERWSSEYAEGYRIEYDQDIPKFLRKYGKKWGAEVGKTTLDNAGTKKMFVAPDGNEYSTFLRACETLFPEGEYDIATEMLNITTEKEGNVTTVYDSYGVKMGDITEISSGTEVWQMTITDAMRDSVLYEGQVMYSRRDSDGNQLTDAQAEFFKDSKIRDNEGNLLVMYHGSPFKFTTFEDRPAINGRQYGNGFYFTDSKNLANAWGHKGKLYKTYVNITNPYVVSKKEPVPDGVMDIIKEQEGRVYDKLSSDEKWWGNKYTRDEFVEYMAEDLSNSGKAFFRLDNATEALKSLGYDGIAVINELNFDARYQEVVAFYPNQIKLTTNKKPTKDNDIRYSRRESDGDYGYHAGDLGKAESLAQQGYGRDTGHFGTGTYFVGNEEAINIGSYKGRPHEKVDFSKYNLYKVDDSDTGYRLHDFLRGVDGFFNLDEGEIRTKREWERRKDDLEYAIFEEEISEADAIKEAKILFGEYDFGRILTNMANAPEGKWIGFDNEGTLYLTDQETYRDEEIPMSDLHKYVDVYDVINRLIYDNRYAPRIISNIESWDNSLDLNSIVLFGKSKKDILGIINEVKEEIANANYSYEDKKTVDSASTRFMKKLGYEGIDVRGTSLDNTTYGSVIYDLKGEDLARKQEIGTARYSRRYDDGADAFVYLTKNLDADDVRLMFHEVASDLSYYDGKYTNLQKELRKSADEFDSMSESDLRGLFGRIQKAYDDMGDEFYWYGFSLNTKHGLREFANYRLEKEAGHKVKRYEELLDKLFAGYGDLDKNLLWSLYRVEFLKGNNKTNLPDAEFNAIVKEIQSLQEEFSNVQYSRRYDDSFDFLGNEELIKEAKKVARDKVRERDDKIAKKTKIDNIRKNVKHLAEYLEKNTKDKHIIDELKEPVRNLLVSIDYATRKSIVDASDQQAAIAKLEKNVAEARKNVDLRANLTAFQMSAAQDEMLQRAGVDFSSDIEALTESLGQLDLSTGEVFVLRDMSLEDVDRFDRMIRTLRTVITRANYYSTLKRKLTISASAHESFDFFNSLGEVTEGKLDGVANFFNYDTVTPIWFFDRLGPVGKDLFQAFVRGQSRQAFNVAKAKKFSDSLCSEEKKHQWDTDLIEFTVVDAKKTVDITKPVMKKVYTTTSRLMTLYLHDKREQSQGHLYKGAGGRFTTFEHKGKTYGEDVNGVVLTKNLVQQMLTKLDPEAKKVADKISVYLNTVCKELGNEVTRDLYDTELFLEPKYVPIEVVAESVSRRIDKSAPSITALLNEGFTKETKPNAKNQIVLDSIFDVFGKHTAKMITYNAFAREVYDAVRWFEYNEKKQTFVNDKEDGQTISDNIQIAMRGALGKGAVKYFRNFLEDINGAQQAGRGNDLLSKAFSNSKLAAVAWNMNVYLLQPFALIRAMIIVNPKYLAKGLFGIPSGIKSAMEHSGTALHKSFGFYETDISLPFAEQIKGAKTFGEKMKEWSMKGAEVMDKVTWGALWKACEHKVLDENKAIKRGSDEFYDMVVEIFDETVYRTQVMDSVLSRSQIMRDKNTIKKGLTSFMAEPLLTYNTVYGVFSEWNQYSRQGLSVAQCSKKCGKKLAVAIGAYGLSALTEAGIRTLTSAMRNAGSDDEEDENVFLEEFWSALNPLSKIPILRELVSALEGYGVSAIPGLDTIESFVYAYKALCKIIVDGEEVSYKKVYKLLQAVSKASGQGISNAYRDIIAIWNSTIGQMYPSLIIETDE